MMTTNRKQKEKGFALLIAVVVSSIVLSIGISILNITLKEFILSSTIRDSQIAFNAANAGLECALYWDYGEAGGALGKFHPSATPGTMSCMGANVQQIGGGTHTSIGGNAYGTTESFQIEWGSPEICSHVYVTKYRSDSSNVTIPASAGGGTCIAGITCTVVQSRGYNRGCDDLENVRTVERGLRSRY